MWGWRALRRGRGDRRLGGYRVSLRGWGGAKVWEVDRRDGGPAPPVYSWCPWMVRHWSSSRDQAPIPGNVRVPSEREGPGSRGGRVLPAPFRGRPRPAGGRGAGCGGAGVRGEGGFRASSDLPGCTCQSASTPTNEGPPRPVVAGLRSGGPRGAVVLRRRDQLAPPRAPRRTSWHLLELIALHPTAEVARPVGRSVGEGAPNAQPPHAREKEPSKVTRSPGADLRPHHPSRAVRLREPHGAPPAGGPLRPVPELVRPGLPRGHHRVPDGQGPGAGGRRGPDCG